MKTEWTVTGRTQEGKVTFCDKYYPRKGFGWIGRAGALYLWIVYIEGEDGRFHELESGASGSLEEAKREVDDIFEFIEEV